MTNPLLDRQKLTVAGIVLVPASMLPVPVHEHRASLDRVALWPAP